MDKNKYGQYMTPEIIADFMVSLSNIDKNLKILEPSSWEGIFIDVLNKKWFNNITAFEIDNELIQKNHSVINKSFVSSKKEDKYDLIIGNPPYIRWKNLELELKTELENNNLWNVYCNSLCDYSYIFIIKSIELLKDGWELIFITPEYWLSTTNAKTVRNYMVENWYFEEIFHFNDTPIFENVTVSTIIFKYIKWKNNLNKKINVTKYFKNKKLDENILKNLKKHINKENTDYFEITQFKKDTNWVLANIDIINELKIYEEKCKNTWTNMFYTIKDICDIGNGMVSWLDKAFQIDISDVNNDEKDFLLKVIKAKNLKPYIHKDVTYYLYLNEEVKNEDIFMKRFPNFYRHLQNFKEKLNKRYNYNRDIKYWEWVFLRNLKLFSKKQQRIFVPCKERISNKNYFRFSLINEWIFPTQDVTAIFKKDETEESIYYILAFLNSKYVFDWLRFNWIVKGHIVEFSEKPIASIPYRKINFNNENEVKIHNNIEKLTKKYIKTEDVKDLNLINSELDKLFI